MEESKEFKNMEAIVPRVEESDNADETAATSTTKKIKGFSVGLCNGLSSPSPDNSPRIKANNYWLKKLESLLIDINGSSSMKTKIVTPYTLMPYAKMKMQIDTARFKYKTIVIGDEEDDELQAMENVYKKGWYILNRTFRPEVRASKENGNGGSNDTGSVSFLFYPADPCPYLPV